jgi:alpha-tubulin suppressor-like RCC1 family protein
LLGSALALLAACGGVAVTPLGHRRAVVLDASPADPLRVVQLAAGEDHTCALRSDGTVVCWGDNRKGQLGIEGRGIGWEPVRVPGVEGAVQIAAGPVVTCARRREGTVRCWGAVPVPFGFPPAMELDGLAGAVDVAVGDNQVCIVRRDAAVVCQSTRERSRPVTIAGAPPAVEVTVGNWHACALARDGAVACWGSNVSGQLGIGSTREQKGVVEVEGIHEAVQIQTSMNGTCAWEQDGTVACWGDLGAGVPVTLPFQLPGVQGLSGIAATFLKACGWFADGSIECVTRSNGRPLRSRVELGRRAVQLVAGGHFCALDAEGGVSCWGGNGALGQLADPGRVVRALPVAVPGIDDARDLVATDVGACALRATGEIVCWGRLPRFGAVSVPEGQFTMPHIHNAVHLAAGDSDVCAVLADGSAHCWALDRDHSPSTVFERRWRWSSEGYVPPFSGVRAMTLGDQFACALGADGHVQCAGKNHHGQLGDGTTQDRAEAVTVLGLSGVAEIATDGAQTCARLAGGTVKCWGFVGVEERAADRALGPGHLAVDFLTGADFPPQRYGQRTLATSPEEVKGIDGVVRLVGVGPRLCAVRRDGTIACWGRMRHEGPRPAAAFEHAIDVAGDTRHACAIFADRRVGCTGENDRGELGRGTLGPEAAQPAPVSGIAEAEQVACGLWFSCARLRDGGVRCWGSDQTGELGDGGPAQRETPVMIRGLTAR